MTPLPDDAERFRLHAEICKVLTDPKRLMLLDALRAGERSVGDLAAHIGSSLPNASQHLAVLRGAGLVEPRRTGTVVMYRLSEPEILGACDVVGRIVRRRVEASNAGRAAAASGGAASPDLVPAPLTR